jgi:hypothetical protein
LTRNLETHFDDLILAWMQNTIHIMCEISFACLAKYAFFFGIGKIMTDNQVKCTILGE